MKLRLLALIALASALTLSFTVSPAGAGLGGRVVEWTDCDGFGSEFSTYETLLDSLRAGGGSKIKREPELGSATEIGPQKGRGGGFFEVVPTWFHIVHDTGGSGNVTNKAVWHQLYVLNGTFAGFEHGGTNAGFMLRWRGSRARRTRPGTTPAPGAPTSEP